MRILKTVIVIFIFTFCIILDPIIVTHASTEDEWHKINTTMFGGIIQDIIIDPKDDNQVYAGTPRHGLYYSNNKGDSWINLNNNIPHHNIQCISINPSDSYSLLIGTPIGLFKSYDNGKNWIKAIGLSGSVNCIIITSKGMIFAGTNIGVFKMEEKKFQFYQLIDNYVRNIDIRSLCFHPIEEKTIFAGTFNKGIIMTIDDGNIWENISRNLPKASLVSSLIIHPDKPNLLIAGLIEDGLWAFPLLKGKAIDPDSLWFSTKYSNSSLSLQITDMTINYSKTKEILISTKNLGIFSLNIDAKKIESLNLDNDFKSIISISSSETDNSFIVLGTYGRGIVKTLDNGSIWSLSNKGLDAISVASLTIDEKNNKDWYAVSFGCLYISHNMGEKWEMLTNEIPITDINEIQIDPFVSGKFLIATNEGIFVSTNDCKNWSMLDSLHYKLITTIAINPHKPNIYYAGTSSKGIYKSIDGGTSWSFIELYPDIQSNNNTITVIRFDPIDSNILYFGTSSNGIYKTKTDGNNWDHIYYVLGVNTYINDIQVSENSNIIYSGIKIINKGGFIKSENQGQSWISTNYNGFGMVFQKIAIFKQNDNILFSGTNEGAFYSKDRGYHWSPLINGIESFLEESDHQFYVYSLITDPSNSKRLIMSCDYGLFEFYVSQNKLIIDRPTIDIIFPISNPFYTNEPKLTIKGKITDIHGVKNQTINEVDIVLDNNGFFEKEFSLNRGDNLFIIQAQDNDFSFNTYQLSIFFDDKNPVLELETPRNSDILINNRVLVKGRALDENTDIQLISINSETIEVVKKENITYFEHTVKNLRSGENRIEIIAKDLANNETTTYVNVFSKHSEDNHPIIELDNPKKELFYTQENEFVLKGKIFDNEFLIDKATLNNNLLSLDKDGYFSYLLTLNNEKTIIEIIATNEDGIKNQITITAIIDKEIPKIILINPIFNKNPINNYYNPFSLKFLIQDVFSNVEKITIYRQDKEIKSIIPLNESNFEEMIPMIKGMNKFKIDVVDLAGNKNSINFALKHIPSTIILLKIADKKVTINSDGAKKMLLLDSPPIIKKGRTLVPIRFISEIFGAKVKWIPAPTNEVQIDYKQQFVIHLWLTKSYAYIEYPKRTKNQVEKKPLDVNPIIQNGRVLVPLRFISDIFKAITNWYPQTSQIEIIMPY